MDATSPSRTNRVRRLFLGLTLWGVGIALMVVADLGLGPWDVLHQGISRRTGVPIGTVGIAVGLVVLLLWLPLRERPGFGTVANVVWIGVVLDLALLVLPAAGEPSLPVRVVLLLAGPLLIGIGSGFYIGAGLGVGPRDGLMTGLARRGWSVAVARTAIEVSALVTGIALGGTAGIGTVLFAVTIGPIVAWSLPRLTLPTAQLQRGAMIG